MTHHVIPCRSLGRQNFKTLPEQIFYRLICGPYHRVIDHLSLFEGRPVWGTYCPRTHRPEFVSCTCSKALVIGFGQSSFDGRWNSWHFWVFCVVLIFFWLLKIQFLILVLRFSIFCLSFFVVWLSHHTVKSHAQILIRVRASFGYVLGYIFWNAKFGTIRNRVWITS